MKRIIILLVTISSMAGVASAEPCVNISPQTIDTKLGNVFTVNVTIDPKGDERICAASYDLYFDATTLAATEQTQGDFLSHGGAETYEVVNGINNTIGKIQYDETRLDNPEYVGGVTEPGLLASVTFKVVGEGISDLTLKDVQFVDLNPIGVDPPQKPFLVYGCVCYDNGSLCRNLGVSITNLNTGEEWEADTSDSYYQITLTSGVDLNASEILQFNVTDGTKSCVADYTITTGVVDAGGFFNFNLPIPCKKGDVDSNDIINIMDVRLLSNQVSNPEEYPIGDGCEWAGDIDDSGGINMTDVQLLLDRVFKI